MSLSRRLERLEAAVSPGGGEPPSEALRWHEAWHRALVTVLENMPEDRARPVADDLTNERDASPVTRRVLALAASAVPAWWAAPGECRLAGCACAWHYGRNGPLALPEAVCGLLDEHPEAVFDYVDCADCGYRSGERTWEEWRRYPDGRPEITPAGRAYPGGRAYFERCPLCGGAVGWRAHYAKRARALRERQEAEYEAGRAGDARYIAT